jgi:hypothetical protein
MAMSRPSNANCRDIIIESASIKSCSSELHISPQSPSHRAIAALVEKARAPERQKQARKLDRANLLDASGQSAQDSLELRSYHRQHWSLNSIELVEAAPGTNLHKTTKDASHSLVIQPVTAVEDHAVQRHSFSQIFCRLGLSGTGGTRWGATEPEAQRLSQSHEAPIRERCNDQTPIETLTHTATSAKHTHLKFMHVLIIHFGQSKKMQG